MRHLSDRNKPQHLKQAAPTRSDMDAAGDIFKKMEHNSQKRTASHTKRREDPNKVPSF